MQFPLAALVLLPFVASVEVTPTQKVIDLLNNMATKGKKEMHEEQVMFAAYKQFCGDTSTEKQRSIKLAEEQIETLTATIAKATADADKLAREITGHQNDIAAWEGDMKAATKVRGIENDDYTALHQDYSESIDALKRAIEVLKAQAHNRKQASMAQVSALNKLDMIPNDAKKALNLFLVQSGESDLALDSQEPGTVHGYEFQSHGVIDMLEKLQDKFIEERTELEKKEMNRKHAYDMLIQDLSDQTTQAKKHETTKTANRASTLQAKADANGDLVDTSSMKDVDSKYLSELTATCATKGSDFEQRQQLRKDELVALQKAIEILSGNTVAGAAEKHLPGAASALVQRKSAAALAQFLTAAASPAQERAAQFLQSQGQQLNSRILSALATRVAQDPFAKVKKMIKDLIVRLMEEANEEASHKGWCDTELAYNEQTRTEKTDVVQTLHAEIDELEASMAQLSTDITRLTEEVAALDATMAEETEFRNKERAKNEATIKDAKEAQTAVAQAIVVLREFYAKAGEATALVQKTIQEQPPIFDSAYTGMQAESGGVVGMLEVIEADFARLEADTSSSETSAQKAYDELMTSSKVDKATKSKDIEHKSAKKQAQNSSLATKKGDLEGTQKELDAALSYYEKLKPSCVDAGVSYDDRVNRRKDEIQSLQEALRILNGEDIA